MTFRWVFALVVLIFAPCAALAEMTVAARLAPGQPPVVMADRTVAPYPENSLAGIDHAIAIGADMVRLDIQLTRDGQYVVMHDWTLNRTTDVEEVYPDGPPQGPSRAARGGKDYLRDYTLEDLSMLGLTGGQDGGTHPVPTFEQALDLVAGRALISVGLKRYDAGSLAALLRGRDTGNLVFFDIFYADPGIMDEITRATGIPAFVAIGSTRDPAGTLETVAGALGGRLLMVTVDPADWTPGLAARADELGVRLCLSGVKGGEDSALTYRGDPGPWQAALDLGAAAYLTADPEGLIRLLGP